MKNLLAFLLILAGMTNHTNAQVIHVPADQPTIQAGIFAAGEGDTILVSEGTYFENIDFIGKAITIASHFIIDKDTLHISKTIIDGSQASHPDSGSVVSMVSDEDTTSVICGFTITGGSGTISENGEVMGGGGILCWGGGKIESNIITLNKITSDYHGSGGGIYCYLYTNIVIRNNKIMDNELDAIGAAHGAGIELLGMKEGGYAMIEENTIESNIGKSSNFWAGGGGMRVLLRFPTYGYDVIIRNNDINSNELDGTHFSVKAHGAGMNIAYFDIGNRVADPKPTPSIYNNIIRNNISEFVGGGISVTTWCAAHDPTIENSPQLGIINNTLINNTAREAAGLYNYDSYILLMNNIFWDDLSYIGCKEFSAPEISPMPGNGDVKLSYMLTAAYNNIQGGWLRAVNLDMEPGLDSESFISDPDNPCIGRGVDSIKSGGVLFNAPDYDYSGNERPDAVDSYIDLGAHESKFKRSVLSVADLSYIRLDNCQLCPTFQKDTMCYRMVISNITGFRTQLDYALSDWLAFVDINHAVDVYSHDPSDRTTTITVTASDGITQKKYRIEFRVEGVDYPEDLSTNIKEPITKNLLLYPNPVTDILNVKTGTGGFHKIVITSLNGQVIYSATREGFSHQIDLSSFQKGIYFITIRTGDNIITDKIFKL